MYISHTLADGWCTCSLKLAHSLLDQITQLHGLDDLPSSLPFDIFFMFFGFGDEGKLEHCVKNKKIQRTAVVISSATTHFALELFFLE